MMKNKRSNQLIIFTRYPRSGSSKTRLIPALGAKKAALLQKAMTELTLKEMAPLMTSGAVNARIFFHGCTRFEIEDWLGPMWIFEEQSGTDLGYKMARAFDVSFSISPDSHSILIGTDIHKLGRDIILDACQYLDLYDLVLGPAVDGGYYLIGLNEPRPELFRDIEWGSPLVLEQTLNKARINNLKVRLLKELSDIDRPEDLNLFDETFLSSLGTESS